MKKIIEYETLYNDRIFKLDESVNNYLNDGWELYGNPFTNESYIVQTMVKYEDSLEMKNVPDSLKYGYALNYENK